MIRYRYLLPLIIIALLCASCTSENYYAKAVHSWKGASTKTLFERWGYPDRIARLPNGHRLLIYRKIGHPKYPPYVTPGFTGGATQKGTVEMVRTSRELSGDKHHHVRCTAWFEVNKRNRIVAVRARGEHCLAPKSFYDSYTIH